MRLSRTILATSSEGSGLSVAACAVPNTTLLSSRSKAPSRAALLDAGRRDPHSRSLCGGAGNVVRVVLIAMAIELTDTD
jgi:hypothetical protein